jgi:hypothetical protein
LVRLQPPSLRSLIADHLARQFFADQCFSVRGGRRFSAPACTFKVRRAEQRSRLAAGPPPEAARSGLDGCEHGAMLDQVGGYCPAGSWFFPRSVDSRNLASGRSAPLCPERGHRERAATKGARLPGLVPAGTGSRLDQADLNRPTNWPDRIMRRPGRRPSQSHDRPSRRGA